MTPRRSLAFAAAVITGAVVLQQPGKLLPETKLDLVVAPARFLGRALHLWQPDAGFGHVPNQAAGYLFPMGPFFALGDGVGLPLWLVQRAWIAGLLVLSLWGTARLCDAIGIGRPATRVAAGAAYALSGPMIGSVAFTSAGQLPMALLPWLLLALVQGAQGLRSPRVAGARAGLVFLCMGAVNAASTLAVLPLPVLYVVTRRPGRDQLRLAAWWAGSTMAVAVWWIVPLLLQRRYGFDFGQFTERAATTTASGSTVEVVRGTGYWLGYLFVHGPWLPAAWAVIRESGAVIATTMIAAAGLAGLARRDVPERTFLALGLATGVVVIGVAYAGPLGGPFAPALDPVLDDQLWAFRNLAKFQPVLRLPLALGLAHVLAVGWSSRRRFDRSVRIAPALAAAAIVVASLPLWRGELPAAGAFESVPEYWRDAAEWLRTNGARGRSVLVPSAPFAEYTWGRPLDDPLAALDPGPWAVRDLVPLGSAGNTRLLDELDRRLTAGGDLSGVAEVLRASGVRFVVARNDLDVRRSGAPQSVHVRGALQRTPGLRLARTFGPAAGAGPSSDRLEPDLGVERRRARAVEVYEVSGPVTPVTVFTGPARVLSGGPEDLFALASRGRLGGPVVEAGDEPGATATDAPALLTDGLRHRDEDPGRVRDNRSYVLRPSEAAPDTGRAPSMRAPVAGGLHRTTARLDGAETVRASSYGPSNTRTPEGQPWAAFDGDPTTAWTPSPARSSLGQWIQLDLLVPRDLTRAQVRLLGQPPWAPHVNRLRVVTEAGSRVVQLAPTEGLQLVPLPRGRSKWIRFVIAGVDGPGLGAAGLREIVVPGVRVDRRLRLPDDQRDRLAAAPIDTMLFTRGRTDPYDATRRDEEGRMDREVYVPVDTELDLEATASPRPGTDLRNLVKEVSALSIRADESSVWQDLPRFAGQAALDGNHDTAWLASPADAAPSLLLSWDEPRVLDAVEVRGPTGPVLTPVRLRLVAGGEQRDVVVGIGPSPVRPPLETDRVAVTVVATALPPETARGLATPFATGLAELRFPALDDLRRLPDLSAPFGRPCGEGPTITIDGKPQPTALIGTLGDLVSLTPLLVTGCDERVRLGPGPHRFSAPGSDDFVVDALVLTDPAPRPIRPGRWSVAMRWDDEHRVVRVGAGPAGYLATAENFNAGWTARAGGHRLAPVRLDGWRQAWRLPVGTTTTDVTLRFEPGRTYRTGLVLGACAVFVVVAAALAPGRPRHRRDLGPARPAPWLATTVATGLVYLLAGALALAVPGLVLLRVLRPRLPLAGLAAGSFAVAGAVVLVQSGRLPGSETGAFGATAQLFAVLAVEAVLAAAIPLHRDD